MTTGALRRHGRVALAAAGILGAALSVALGLQAPGRGAGDDAVTAVFGGLAAAAIVSVAVLPFAIRRGTPPRTWWTIAVVALAAGIVSFMAGAAIQRACTAQYSGRSIIVGTEFTEAGVAYVRANPHLSRNELLFDSAGDPDLMWTPASIDSCLLRVRASYFLWMPFLITCLVARLPCDCRPQMFAAHWLAKRPCWPPLESPDLASHTGSPPPQALEVLTTVSPLGCPIAGLRPREPGDRPAPAHPVVGETPSERV